MYTYSDKHILIIGAGLLQVPAIKTANRIGCKTVVTDYNKDAPGMKIADFPVVVSTRDIEGTVRVIRDFSKKIPIDGVITVGTDASMTVAAVAGALGLPGIPFENAEAASNKYKMRQRLKQHNVPIPEFLPCWSLDELRQIAEILTYPIVIKPVDNMGARGVFKIENENFLETAFNHAKNASPSGELIVEEFMQGPELSIDALIYNNKIFITGVADRIITREPWFIEAGHILPSNLPVEILDDAISVFKAGIKALGINPGAAKGDIKCTPNGAKVGEIAARLSGGFMSAYTYPNATGVDLIHNAIDICLGFEPHNLIPTCNRVSVERAIIPQPGLVKEIRGIQDALDIPGVKNIFLHTAIGEEVVEPSSNVEKAGNIIVVKETREEALTTIEMALKCVKIVTESGLLSWTEIRHRARGMFNRTCFACKECNGIECRGQIPGVGGIGNGNAFINNIKDLQKIKILTRVIHDVTSVNTSTEFLGKKLSLPLAAAPITGCDINLGGNISELDYLSAIMQGCKESGIIGFTGDGAQPDLYRTGLEAIGSTDGHGGILFKPRADSSAIVERLQQCMKQGVTFTGIDVDGAAFLTMELMGQKVEPKSISKLSDLISMTSLPFIIKGIMTASDALAAKAAGASAIVVSNHGGRITENHPSSISVLTDIVDACGDDISIIFDGGIRSGEDIFKALALGADMVMIGRPFSVAVMGAGIKGVTFLIKQYKKQLEKIMLLTGVPDIDSIQRKHVLVPTYFPKITEKTGLQVFDE